MAGELKRLANPNGSVVELVDAIRTALGLLERAAQNHREMQAILEVLRVHPMRNAEDWLADYNAAKGQTNNEDGM